MHPNTYNLCIVYTDVHIHIIIHSIYIYIYCTYNMLQLLLDVTDYFMLSWWAWKLAIFHLNINMPELNTIYSWCFVTAQVWRIDIRPSRLSISQQLRLHLLNVPLGNESCTSYHPSIEGFKVVGFCCICASLNVQASNVQPILIRQVDFTLPQGYHEGLLSTGPSWDRNARECVEKFPVSQVPCS